jgi:hypothetical protein
LDIKGAKALKERLAQSGADDASAAPVDVDVHEDAPPVYHWFGVGQSESESPSAEADDERRPSEPSFFRRLGLSFR